MFICISLLISITTSFTISSLADQQFCDRSANYLINQIDVFQRHAHPTNLCVVALSLCNGIQLNRSPDKPAHSCAHRKRLRFGPVDVWGRCHKACHVLRPSTTDQEKQCNGQSHNWTFESNKIDKCLPSYGGHLFHFTPGKCWQKAATITHARPCSRECLF